MKTTATKKMNQAETRHYDVQIIAPQPNPMFSEWNYAITKLLRYAQPVKCAYCGRMGKYHWTSLKFFRIAEGFEKKINDKVVPCDGFVITTGEELFPPLTPVCRKHILAPKN